MKLKTIQVHVTALKALDKIAERRGIGRSRAILELARAEERRRERVRS